MTSASKTEREIDGYQHKIAGWDFLCLAILTTVGLWFSMDSNLDYISNLPHGDREFYINMAMHPPSILDGIVSPYAQRPLPSLLVWGGIKISNLSLSQVFLIFNHSIFIIFLPLVYYALRSCHVPLEIALGTSLFCGISFWPVTNYLVDIYYACDALTYPLSLIMIMLTIKRKLLPLFIVSVLGVMTRQQLFILAFFSFSFLYFEEKTPQALISLVLILIIFSTLTLMIGENGVSILAKHSVLRIFNFGDTIKGIIRTKLPIMFSPFLLLLICLPVQTISYMKEYWWVTFFALITIMQPLFSYEITGFFDSQRLSMMGVWLFFILAGLLLRDNLKTRWAKWVYAGLPLLYGTEHLNILKHAYPSPLGHRAVMNIIILLLILIDIHGRRRYNKGKSVSVYRLDIQRNRSIC